MSIIDWFKKVFSFQNESERDSNDYSRVYYKIASEIMVRELAFNIVVNKIANAVTKCEINVYYDKKKEKDLEWYRWNIQPNPNQSAAQFWYKLIYKLCRDNEALVITNGGNLYVADDYIYNDDYAFFEHTFTSVAINGYMINRPYRMSEVFYFKLNNENVRTYLNGTLTMYSELMNTAYSNYLVANGNKGILKIDQYAMQGNDFQQQFDQLINEDFKTFFSNVNAVLPLYDGFDYKELEAKGNVTTRDFKALLDDEVQITANAFNMPASIANGDVQDTSKAIEEFLTFCIDPLIKMLTDEMNRKSFTPKQLERGTCYRFNTLAIKHIDLFDISTSIDKLISSGFTCINDLREISGMDIIDEEWAYQFFMTKNYSTIQDLLISKGGEEN